MVSLASKGRAASSRGLRLLLGGACLAIASACGNSSADLTDERPCTAPCGDGGADHGASDDDTSDDDASDDDSTDDDSTDDDSTDDDADDDASDDDSTDDDENNNADDDENSATRDDDDDDVSDDDSSEDDLALPTECDVWDGGRVRAEFLVPGVGGVTGGDYFRLPFPNDIRTYDDGTVDLTGFPSATGITQGFIDALDGTREGFGNYPTVTMRFSGMLDYETLAERVAMVDITDPENPIELGVGYVYSAGGGEYVCHDSLSIRPPNGVPLTPRHTYAVFVRSGVLDDNGLEVAPSDHLQTLLAPSTPEDDLLARAHRLYTPLREYLTFASLEPEDVVLATVFTTEDPTTDMATLAELLEDLPTPSLRSWAKCGVDPSPCPDTTGTRACGSDPSVDEYHAMVTLPIFQEGEAPYLQQGGAINFAGAVREEQVCMAVSVPTGPVPAEGFPLVLHGHGAGGSFRSAMAPRVAGSLALHGPDTGATPVAVLGFDQVMHGPRRGTGAGSTLEPDLLLFNILNPTSARGTTLQAGADVLSMARVAKTVIVPAAVTGGTDITFDTRALGYWGHSQGGSQGALALPFSNEITFAVLSGTGAGILHSLLERTNPASIPIAVRDSIADPGPAGSLIWGDGWHPALGILQHWCDAVDPLHFGARISRAPDDGIVPKHLFLPYGIGDTYSPSTNLRNFLSVTGAQGTEPHESATSWDDLGPVLSLPVRGNVAIADVFVTVGFRQYRPSPDSDGHFVAFNEGNEDVVRFLTEASRGEIPTVGPSP